jgi:hypothetical protein
MARLPCSVPAGCPPCGRSFMFSQAHTLGVGLAVQGSGQAGHQVSSQELGMRCSRRVMAPMSANFIRMTVLGRGWSLTGT